MCDTNCTVTFTKYAVNIYSTTGTPIITGFSESTEPCLWRMSIIPNQLDIPPLPYDHKTTRLQSFSDYDLLSVEAIIRYFHMAAFLPVRDTWLKSTKIGSLAF